MNIMKRDMYFVNSQYMLYMGFVAWMAARKPAVSSIRSGMRNIGGNLSGFPERREVQKQTTSKTNAPSWYPRTLMSTAGTGVYGEMASTINRISNITSKRSVRVNAICGFCFELIFLHGFVMKAEFPKSSWKSIVIRIGQANFGNDHVAEKCAFKTIIML